ncbi:hypothetical protein [Hymenobacter qilianensis]|uniref:hypothetical protein n=1 Tax=Hymenobacter qilianensis TaxID=1385715 RepID=UPI00374243BE
MPLPAPDEYRELNQALSLALFDYMRKARSRGFVLSLSGGADSCMCAVAVAEMVRLGTAELGTAEFMRRAGCFTAEEIATLAGPVAPVPDQNAPGPKDASLSLLNQEQKSINQKLTGRLLTTAYQGTVNSSDDTFQSAKELADELGAFSLIGLSMGK